MGVVSEEPDEVAGTSSAGKLIFSGRDRMAFLF